jgi:hypothetical protein
MHRKEDLGLYGNQLNYMQTAWTIGYIIGQIPSNLLLTRLRPRYWIPTMEVTIPTQFHIRNHICADFDSSLDYLVHSHNSTL